MTGKGKDEMKQERHRVCITGMGVLSAIGLNREEVRAALLAGKGGITKGTRFSDAFSDCYDAEVDDSGLVTESLPGGLERNMGKCSRWGWRVVKEAIDDAALSDSDVGESFLLVGMSANEDEMLLLSADAENSYSKTVLSGNFSSISNILSHIFGIRGGSCLVTTACTSGTNALGYAFDLIQGDKTQIAIVVSAEPISWPVCVGFHKLKNIARGACSPFSGESGMSLGEAAGCLIVEKYEHATARKAKIYGEILGYAATCDAYHETAPDPKGEAGVEAARRALAMASIEPDEIEYINAHGTGTELNDRVEALILQRVFPAVADIPVSSLKSYLGHTIGSTGIVEILCSLLTLPGGTVLPTINFSLPRHGCDFLRHVPNIPMQKKVNLFISSNYAFGGNNCSMVISCRSRSVKPSLYKKQRVAVTGIGVITAGIAGWECFLNMHETAGISEVTKAGGADTDDRFSTEEKDRITSHLLNHGSLLNRIVRSLPPQRVYRVHRIHDASPGKYLRSYDERKSNRVTDFAAIAMKQAMKQGSLDITKHERDEGGIILGISSGPLSTIASFMDSIYLGIKKTKTKLFPMTIRSYSTTRCATLGRLRGYNTTISNGFCSSMGALFHACEIIRQDIQSYMIAGGADEFAETAWFYIHSELGFIDWSVDKDRFAVFGARGRGFYPGEGACQLLLEPMERATGRGATVYAEIAGYGQSCDGTLFPELDRTGESLAAAIGQALAEAGLSAGDIDAVYGTSWGTDDINHKEIGALHRVFGREKRAIPVSNTNGYYGFIESSSGALSVAAAIASIAEQVVYPIPRGGDSPYSGDFHFVTGKPLAADIRNVLVLASSEYGSNYAVIVRKYDGS